MIGQLAFAGQVVLFMALFDMWRFRGANYAEAPFGVAVENALIGAGMILVAGLLYLGKST